MNQAVVITGISATPKKEEDIFWHARRGGMASGGRKIPGANEKYGVV